MDILSLQDMQEPSARLYHTRSMLRTAAHLPGVGSAAALAEAAPRRLQRALLEHQVREDLLAPPVAAALEPEDELGGRPIRVRRQTRLARDHISLRGIRRLLFCVLAVIFRPVPARDIAASSTQLVHIHRKPCSLTEVGKWAVGLSRRDGPGQMKMIVRATVPCKAAIAG